jgi:hypothetical protein
VLEKRANVQFHFKRNHEGTEYSPTITYEGKKIALPNPAAYLICKLPAWMVIGGKLYGFDKFVDGKKLQPFLSKPLVKNSKETGGDLLQSFYWSAN